jgi:hypothetical protein
MAHSLHSTYPAESAPRLRAPARWVASFPDLVAQWHPTRNGHLRPEDVSRGSGHKIWWRCARGPDHEWRASPKNRTVAGTGCPFCAGRRVSITNCLARVRPDLARHWHPTRNDLTPDRIVAGSTKPAWWKCPVAADHEWRVSPHDRASVEGACPFCLCSRVSTTNSLATTRPTLAAEWHPTKNGLRPDQVVPGSARRVWWRCARDPEHEWRAAVSSRTRGTGCPFCSGRKASGKHCLAVARPEIAAQWHPRNFPLMPEAVTPRARRRVWWRCGDGHEWQAQIIARTKGRGTCPECWRRTHKGRPRTAERVPSLTPTSVVGYLRGQHRRIEQLLTILDGDPSIDGSTTAYVAAGIAAYLKAEEASLYPVVERAWNRALGKERESNAVLLVLLSKVRAAVATGASPREHVADVSAAFHEHAGLVEWSAFACLDGARSPASERAIRRQLADLLAPGPIGRLARASR